MIKLIIESMQENLLPKKRLEPMLYNGVYVPQSYRDRILKHIILNCSSDLNGQAPPLILSIQGKKGEGKSFMLKKLCEYYNIEPVILSGSELCGPNEGDAKNVIQSKYEKSCCLSSSDRKFRVVIIDDFHMSIAGDISDNISKTSNSFGLIGYLMNLCDNSMIHGIRTPIIMTGNNFTKTYDALTRNGRMTFLDWVPNVEEKKNIVYYMFKASYPDISRICTDTIVDYCTNESIAFFESVLKNMFFKQFANVIDYYHQNAHNINYDNIDDVIKNYIRVEDVNEESIMCSVNEVMNDKARSYEDERRRDCE